VSGASRQSSGERTSATIWSRVHRLAGVSFRVKSAFALPHLDHELFEPFRVSSEVAEVELGIHALDPDARCAPPLSPEEQSAAATALGIPRRWLSNELLREPRVREVLDSCLRAPELSFVEMAWNRLIFRNHATNHSHLFYPDGGGVSPDRDEFVARYRNMLCPFFPNFDAVMIHAGAVIRGGKAALFLAHDGGGKTTVVRTALGSKVLSDDQVILRREKGEIRAHGTPLGRFSSGPVEAPVGGIFLLEKSRAFSLTSIRLTDVIEFLWNEHRFVWPVLPKSIRAAAFDMVYESCRGIPLHRMQFRPDSLDWAAVDSVLARG